MLLPWHNSALTRALFHLGKTRKSASHSALLFPFYMNVCSDIKNKNAKRPNFHKGSQSHSPSQTNGSTKIQINSVIAIPKLQELAQKIPATVQLQGFSYLS